MLKRNITEIFAPVILIFAVCLIFSACDSILPKNAKVVSDDDNSKDYDKPKVIGAIDSKEITESSGIAASGCNKNVLWTHNDSGDDAFIFALDLTGRKLGTWKVANAKNVDWEDIAETKNANGECFLYIGDIGGNTSARNKFTIYKVREPTVSGATNSSKKNPLETEAAAAIEIQYPDSRRDAETLMVNSQTGDIYILSKRLSEPSAVYRLKAGYDLSKTNTLEKLTDFKVPAVPNGFLTGGDISPDGKRAIICDYFSAYELILPDGAKNFDEIWRQKPLVIELGTRAQGEAVGYSADGKSIYATSEGKNSPLIEVDRK
ncbi:MAG: hypothetical protein ACR2N3_18445 [Pyrinomonadaceae bacterium]